MQLHRPLTDHCLSLQFLAVSGNYSNKPDIAEPGLIHRQEIREILPHPDAAQTIVNTKKYGGNLYIDAPYDDIRRMLLNATGRALAGYIHFLEADGFDDQMRGNFKPCPALLPESTLTFIYAHPADATKTAIYRNNITDAYINRPFAEVRAQLMVPAALTL